MNKVKWTLEKTEPVVKLWCAGFSGGQIAKQTDNETFQIKYILDRVALANNLSVRSELREHSPALLLKRFGIWREEAKGRAVSGNRAGNGTPLSMTAAKLEKANKEFLALLEKHHGNDMRAAG